MRAWKRWLHRVVALLPLLGSGTPAFAQDFPTLQYLQATNVSAWTETTRITRVELTPTNVTVTFAAQQTWPMTTPPGWDGGIQYTLWPVVADGRGRWLTTGAIELWKDRDGVDGPFSRAAQDWYYFVPEMSSLQPSPGARTCLFVTQGDQRRKDASTLKERSNLVCFVVPASDTGVFTFDDTISPVVVTTPTTPIADDTALTARIQSLETALAALGIRVQSLESLPPLPVAPPFPHVPQSCSASVYGIPIHCTLNP